MKNVIITGSNGLLGQKLVKLLRSKKDFKIFALSRGEDRMIDQTNYSYYNIDLTHKEKLTRLIDKIKPDILIHTAAMTNVDACELDNDKCDIINVDVVKTIVELCSVHKCHLIHLSTDFIFDGEKETFYSEEDKPNPVNYYGFSKLKSEKIIQESEIKFTILRTILVYGMVDRNDRSNIVLWVKKSLEEKKNINVVTDQYRMPTFADDLAESCLLAIEHNAFGIFNVSSNQLLSIYDIAIEVAKIFQLDTSLIKPIKTEQLSLPAVRPPNTGFYLNKSIVELQLPSYTFIERLRVFKDQLLNFERA